MTDEELDTLGVHWLAEQQRRSSVALPEIDWSCYVGEAEASSTYSTNQMLSSWAIDGRHDDLWRFLQAAYPRLTRPNEVAYLAAGPLEDLLSKFGPAYIARVESLARSDTVFRDLLGGEWKSSMTEAVWARVQAVRGRAW